MLPQFGSDLVAFEDLVLLKNGSCLSKAKVESIMGSIKRIFDFDPATVFALAEYCHNIIQVIHPMYHHNLRVAKLTDDYNMPLPAVRAVMLSSAVRDGATFLFGSPYMHDANPGLFIADNDSTRISLNVDVTTKDDYPDIAEGYVVINLSISSNHSVQQKNEYLIKLANDCYRKFNATMPSKKIIKLFSNLEIDFIAAIALLPLLVAKTATQQDLQDFLGIDYRITRIAGNNSVYVERHIQNTATFGDIAAIIEEFFTKPQSDVAPPVPSSETSICRIS
jgi:hypothetical protein